MKPAPFQYHAPKTIAETLDLLGRYAHDDGRVLAGGQSLVPTMAFRLARPKHLIDINGVTGLDRITVENGRAGKRGSTSTCCSARSAACRTPRATGWKSSASP